MENPTGSVVVLDIGSTDDWDIAWVPEDGGDEIEEYYEAESWQFSGCGD